MSERPKLKRDWVGRKVELLRTLRTRGGVEFTEGTVMVVSNNRGSLSLRAETPNQFGYWAGRIIRRVSEYDVRLLPIDRTHP